MTNPLISSSLVVLTLLSLVGEWLALQSLTRDPSRASRGWCSGILIGIAGGCLALFGYRLAQSAQWQPVSAHVDGLLLIGALLAGAIAFVQAKPRLRGLAAFAIPLLTLVLAWAVCAAWWTYRPFDLDTLHPIWMAMHLAAVYVGTLAAIIAAVTGGMYLYVQRRLKQKRDLLAMGRLASLEMLEGVIIRAATLGFALLTLGLAGGLVILLEMPQTAEAAMWLSPKVLLAVAAWAAYALVMNVRHTTTFRGARAAWVAIAGLVLLLSVYGIITAMPAKALASPAATPAVAPEGR